MAGIAYVYKRLWNPDLVIDPEGVLPRGARQSIMGDNRPTYHIKWHGTTQVGEQLGTAAASVKDGTTTPYVINIVSSSASDDKDTAAGMVHSVAVIGITTSSLADYAEYNLNGISTPDGFRGRPQTTVEVFRTNGVADVLSTRYWIWTDHAYACEWGTGATHDAEGAITIEAPPNTTLITIAATFNESDGGAWHFKEGAEVRTHLIRITPTAALVAGDGVALTGTFEFFDHELNDENITDLVDRYTYIHYGGEVIKHEDDMFSRYATKKAVCTWSEALIANAGATDIEIVQTTPRSPR